jgi:hypothetical protein
MRPAPPSPTTRVPHIDRYPREVATKACATATAPLAWLAAVLPVSSPLPDLTPSTSGRGQEALHRTTASQVRAFEDERFKIKFKVKVKSGLPRLGAPGRWEIDGEAVPQGIPGGAGSEIRRGPSGLYRDVGFWTKVPLPTRLTTRPRSRSSRMARRTVW